MKSKQTNASHRKQVVLANLPSTGLGNKLYIWARACIFAKLNKAELFSVGWTRFKLGPFLRREKSKRLYLGQFYQYDFIEIFRLAFSYLLSEHILEPPLANCDPAQNRQQIFIFNQIVAIPDDSFKDFLPFRNYLQDELHQLLKPGIHQILATVSHPIIGIHVRRGDFVSTDWMTSIDYFVRRLAQIRLVAGSCLPATVFSDGSFDELSPLLTLANVTLALPNPDVVDMLLLSRSKILIPCPASTFSNWSAFLSEGVVIRSYLFPHKSARPADINALFFEGIVSDNISEWPELLVNNIQMLVSNSSTN